MRKLRLASLIGALAAFSGAAIMLLQTGLPERAQFTGALSDDDQIIAPEIGSLAPSFEAATRVGRINLRELRGLPVILNFWATWCEPCVIEMPYLQSIYEQYRERSLRLIAVNLGETYPLVDSWVKRNGLYFDIAFDPDGAIAMAYRLRGQPSTFVIAPDGRIANIFYGAVANGQLEAAVAPFLSR
jgi:peroxiredoxin